MVTIFPICQKIQLNVYQEILDVGITTVLTQEMKDILQIGRKVGTGNLVTGVIGNIGGTLQTIKLIYLELDTLMALTVM